MLYFFIQARMGSTRLPSKVLLPFFGEQSILDIIIKKLQTNFKSIPIVVCTSTNLTDNVIEEYCHKIKIDCFRGDEQNVLKRFTDAATLFNTKTIIRICADNPFLDMDFLKNLVEYYKENPNEDYWSYKTTREVPVIKTHFGFFAEIVTAKALRSVLKKTDDKLYLEHVTNYVYSNLEYNTKLKLLPYYLKDREDLRFTIDDQQDFKIMKELYLYYIENNCNLEKTIHLVDNNKAYRNKMIDNIKKYSK